MPPPIVNDSSTPVCEAALSHPASAEEDPLAGAARLDVATIDVAAVLAAGSFGIAEIAPSGEFLQVNPCFCRMLQRNRDELIHVGFTAFLALEDVPRALRATAAVLTGGQARPIELRFVRPGDAYVYTNCMLSRIGGEGAATIGLVAITIAPPQLTEERLGAYEDRLRRALDIDTVGVIFLRMDGTLTDANDAFLRMTGYTRDELATHRLSQSGMTPMEWMPALERAFEQLRRAGVSTPFEREYLRKDGTRFWALAANSVLGAGEVVEYVINLDAQKSVERDLNQSREDLEVLVQKRTAELDAVTGALRDEIVEGRRSEAARQALLRQLVTAQEEERRRISRELHDEVGQLLTALMLGLRSLNHDNINPERVTQLHDLAEQLGREVHEMALRLRPTALDDLGLQRTLANYIDEWSQRCGLSVDFHCTGCDNGRLPAHIEATIYRIVQEALTNVVKHARATSISVILERRAEQAVVIVEDNGRGFNPTKVYVGATAKRLGLIGMRERAALVDGELSVESTPGSGTTIFVRIPLPTKTPDSKA